MKRKALSKGKHFRLKRTKLVGPLFARIGAHHTDNMPMQYGTNIAPTPKVKPIENENVLKTRRKNGIFRKYDKKSEVRV